MLILSALGAASLSGGGFAEERSRGTYSDLSMTRLKTSEVLIAKWWVRILPLWAILAAVATGFIYAQICYGHPTFILTPGDFDGLLTLIECAIWSFPLASFVLFLCLLYSFRLKSSAALVVSYTVGSFFAAVFGGELYATALRRAVERAQGIIPGVGATAWEILGQPLIFLTIPLLVMNLPGLNKRLELYRLHE